MERILTNIPLFERMLRKGVRCGIKISENIILFVIGHRIYELDIINRKISDGFATTKKSRPLVFTKIEGLNGFKNGIYFGKYEDNPQLNPVSIYRRTQMDKWEEVYQFEKNTIEHIHNIIPDPYRNLVYILAGDFDHSAGIWIAEDDFKKVKPLLFGNQIYRSCVGFTIPSGLVYVTDSPFSKNSIRLLKQTNNGWESTHVMDVKGPAIYSCQWGDDFVFSTSVEGGSRDDSFFYMLFGRKRGSGVLDNYSHIYKGNMMDGFKEVYSAKKDWLPFYLFQFGALIFPTEVDENSLLPVYHMATKKNGMRTLFLKNELKGADVKIP